MKKKILFVINSLDLGGAEKSLVSLLNTFDFGKYEVDLLMFQPTGLFLNLLPDEVNVLPALDFFVPRESFLSKIKRPKYFSSRLRASLHLRVNRKTKKLHPAQCYWKYTNKCFNYLEKHYSVAIAWGQGNPTHYVAEKVTADKRIAVINVNYEGAGHNKKFDLPYYEKYDNILTVSDSLKQLTCDVFPTLSNNISTLYDISNADVIQRMAKENNPFANEGNSLIIVTVGRLVPQKGYDLAVDAAKVLKDYHIDFKWYFVGDGSARADLEREIQVHKLTANVVLTGAENNPYQYISHADIYVQTSRFEGYCLTLCEARILNKPIVSTNFDVVNNQITNEVNGLIVEMDGKAIAEAIIRLKNDSELTNSFIDILKKEKKGNPEEILNLYRIIEE